MVVPRISAPVQVVAAMVLLCASAALSKPQDKMNVLFFAVDDLRDQLSFLGPGAVGPGCGPLEGSGCSQMVTPNLERLAAMSRVFTKNYVQQAVCSPTRTSLLTGRRPDATRVYDLFSYFRDVSGNYTTIPEYFKNAGYHTVGMGKIFHPGHASGAQSPHCTDCPRGDDFEYSWDSYFHAPNNPYPLDEPNHPHSWMSINASAEAKFPLPDSQLAANAVATIQNVSKSDQPFFVAVGFHRPHLPFIAPEAKFNLYPADSIELPASQVPPEGMPQIAWSGSGELIGGYGDINKIAGAKTLRPGQTLPPQTVKELRRAYYAAVSHMDDQVGKVLDALEASGKASNTIISFWGDHGWQLGDHGEWCKHTNFELAVRAPLLVRVPGYTDKGAPTASFSSHIDLFPTLVEAATGTKLPPCPTGQSILKTDLCAMGTSLMPVIKDPAASVKDASFSQYPRGNVGEHQFGSTPTTSQCIESTGCTMGYTVITVLDGNEFRYTEWAPYNHKVAFGPDWTELKGIELYDMTKDGTWPDVNVWNHSAYSTIVLRLKTILHRGPQMGGGWGPWQG